MNSISILKIGGGKDILANIDEIARDLSTRPSDEQWIIVHGANAVRDDLGERLGNPVRYITAPSGISSVYTDQNTMDTILMAYSGLVNKKLVLALQRAGVNAVGLSGVDGRLLEGVRKDKTLAVEGGKTKVLKDNMTGKVEHVNAKLLHTLLEGGYTPIITIPAITTENELINVDNDRFMAILVNALSASRLVSLFEAPGLLEDADDPKSLIKELKKDTLGKFMDNARGRMKMKMIGAQETFENGLSEMYWGDGRTESPLSKVLNGNGTVIK